MQCWDITQGKQLFIVKKVLFKADLIFKNFSRNPFEFKYFSSLCEPWLKFVNKSKDAKDQESIQSSSTPDPGYQWESDKLTDTTNESHKPCFSCISKQASLNFTHIC